MVHNRVDLAKYFGEQGFKIGAEVGVAGGHFSRVLCENIPGLRLYCIDPWDTYEDNRRGGGKDQQYSNYDLAIQMLAPFNTTLIRQFSMDAVKDFEDDALDFVFIDANHDFDFVMEDIIHWTRKVRSGGIVSGHDFYQFNNSGVIEAVYAYTWYHKLGLNVVGENKKGRHDNDHPCWWFRKI